MTLSYAHPPLSIKKVALVLESNGLYCVSLTDDVGVAGDSSWSDVDEVMLSVLSSFYAVIVGRLWKYCIASQLFKHSIGI